MRAMVYSIPGSGTRFAVKYLSEVLGYEQMALHGLSQKPMGAKVFFQHHVDSEEKRSDLASKVREVAKEGLVVIIPLRSPVATAISRLKLKGSGGHTVPEMLQRWRVLRQNIDDFDHVLLPVEAPWFDHRRLLELVAERLNTTPSPEQFEDMACNWPKVGDSGTRPARCRYDRMGQTVIGDYDSSVFDEETAWYIRRLADFAEGQYRRLER